MSCGCNDVDYENPNDNASCGSCNPCTDSTTTCESLPSALDNFTLHFFGTVSKTMVNGRVRWVLPCNLDVGLPDNPRTAGEGLACYFLRLFREGIVGLTGAKGDKGDAGEDGTNGYTFTTEAFVVPTNACPITQFRVQDPDILPDSAYIFVAGAGWFSIASKTGSLLMVQLVQAVVQSGATVPAGSFVAVTGPDGPAGARGAKGDQGEKGDTGAQGVPGTPGTDGAAASTETLALYMQPAVGTTVLVAVDDSSFFAGNMQVLVLGGGYYEVTAVAPGSLTLRNLGIAATNVAPGVNVPAGSRVVASGTSPVVAAATVVGTAPGDHTINNVNGKLLFATTALEITVPSAGTYEILFEISMVSGSPAPLYVTLRLYDETNVALVGRLCYVNFGSHATSYATAVFRQRRTVVGSTTYSVYGVTDANTADAIQGQCSLDWTKVNPVT